MAVSTSYDKFDDRTSYSTSLHLIDNHSGYQGVYWALFQFSEDPSREVGHLAFLRIGDNWLWPQAARVVLLAGDVKVSRDDAPLVNYSVLFDSNPAISEIEGFREAIEVELTKEDCQALVSAGSAIEGKVGNFQFSVGEGVMKEIAQALSKIAD